MQMSETLLIYDPLDMASRIIRATIVEFGIACRSVSVRTTLSNDHLGIWFARLNPAMSVPVLIKDGSVYSDLAAIENTLAGEVGSAFVQAQPALWLTDLNQFLEQELADAFAFPIARRILQQVLRHRIAVLARLAEKYQTFQPIYLCKREETHKRLKALTNRRQAEDRLRQVDALFSKFEEYIGAKPFLLGAQWSVADAIWTAAIARLRTMGLRDLVNGERHPNSTDYFARMRRRKSFDVLHMNTGRRAVHRSRQFISAAFSPGDRAPALVPAIFGTSLPKPAPHATSTLRNSSGSIL